MQEIIFFGNGPLAEHTLAVLKLHYQIIFHARTKADLATALTLKQSHPKAFGVLASFGVLIKPDVLAAFEPTGILNLHPSKLPEYRGPSPIETAILDGATEFSISIMKLVEAMDAGPIYFQTTCPAPANFTKADIYQLLATTGAEWLSENLTHLPTPTPQDDTKATYTTKLTKDLSPLDPTQKTAAKLQRQIIAFATFPKSTYRFNDLDCIIHSAHVSDVAETALSLKCKGGAYLTIDPLQPAGRKVMDAKSFINGYLRR